MADKRRDAAIDAEDKERFFANNSNSPASRPAATARERKFACLCLIVALVVLVLVTFRRQPQPQPHGLPSSSLSAGELDDYNEEETGLRAGDLPIPPDSAEVDDDEEEEEEEDDSQLPEQSVSAPRSMPSLQYDEMDLANHRYLVFIPSGGMSNQLMGLENAMGLAKLLNRTVYVSRIAKHTNFVSNYLRQSVKVTFPADRLLDFNLLSEYVRVIPLNMSTPKFLEHFAEKYPKAKIHKQITARHYFGRLSKLKRVEAELLFLSGDSMWASFFPSKHMATIRRYVTFSPYLRELSIRIVNKHLKPSAGFYAVHGRLGDERYKWGGRSSTAFLARKSVQGRWNFSRKLYLASETPRDRFFYPLRQAFAGPKGGGVVCLDDLEDDDLKEFHELFPMKEVRQDILGIVEKLICAQATEFEGSPFSTFTWDIERLRMYRSVLIPELRPTTVGVPSSPSVSVWEAEERAVP